LSGATGSDIASYNRHWTKACGSHGDTNSIPTSQAQTYLTEEVAHSSAVSRVLLHFQPSKSDTIDKETFKKAAHILYFAVRTAQEEVFASDDMWGDAPAPNSSGKEEGGRSNSHGGGDKQHDWVIGTVAAAHGISAIDEEEEEALDNNSENTDTAGLTPLSLATPNPSSPESPGDSAGAVSIGDSISAAAAPVGEQTSPGDGATSSSSLANSEWKAFDTAFTNLSMGTSSIQEDGNNTSSNSTNQPPSWTVDMMKHSRQQLSLAKASSKLAIVPGTALQQMPPTERQRCELAFRNKGFEQTGGLREPDAQRIFERSQLPKSSFRTLWRLANTTGAGALDIRQFCLFVHLIKAAVEGKEKATNLLPDTISQLQAAQLLGDVPLAMQFNTNSGTSGNGAVTFSARTMGTMVEPLRLDTARLRMVLHQDETPRLKSTNNNNTNASTTSASISPPAYDSDDTSDDEASSFVDSDGEEMAENEATYGLIGDKSPLTLQLGGSIGAKKPAAGTSTSAAASSASSFANAGKSIPSLAFPAAAATSLPTSRLDRAAWEAEAGSGHSLLQLSFRTAALMQKKVLDRPFISLSVRDPVGRLVELPQESHPGLYRNDIGCIDFSNQNISLKTPLRSLPPGCLLFLEVKQWKSDKRRFSTVAWAFVDAEMMIDSGPVCSRVRCGPMVLPLFKKPMDYSLQKMKRLNGRGPGLHITVRGVE
jgi:Cytoskeletal adhesion